MDSILNYVFKTLYEKYNDLFDKKEKKEENKKRKISYFWLNYRYHFNLKKDDKLENFEKKIENFIYQDEIIEGISVISLEKKEKIEIEIKHQKNKDSFYKIENKEINEYFLRFLIKEISKKNYYILKGKKKNEELYKVILRKVKDSKEEYIDIEYNIKNLVDSRNWVNPIGRFYIHSKKDNRNLKINYKKIDLKSNKKWIEIKRTSIFYNIFSNLISRNIILFPYYVKSENEVIWNEKMKEEYIEFCYKNRFLTDLSKEKIREEVEKIVKNLKKKFLDENIQILEE